MEAVRVVNGTEVPGFACDDQTEFNLPIGLAAISWDENVVKRTYDLFVALRNSTGSVGTGIPDSFAWSEKLSPTQTILPGLATGEPQRSLSLTSGRQKS